MYGVFQWTPDGLIECATAHDRTIAERTRDDYIGHGLIPAGFVAATVKVPPAGGIPAWLRQRTA